MRILNRPDCINYEKCQNSALCLINGMWVCGDCLVKLEEKVKKLKEQFILEG